MLSFFQRWPVRWRLTLTSAALTLMILIAFAVVIGRLASTRLRGDFNSELRSAVTELSVQVEVSNSPDLGPVVRSPRLNDYASPNKAIIRVVNPEGDALASTTNAPSLGRPRPGLVHVGTLEVAAAPVFTNALGLPPAYVQYARNTEDLERTIHRLWLFLIAGVFGGTMLATLAGLAVASRAMRPIAALTAAAREIADTRDPSRRIPEPSSDDEVAELARTLEQMLRSLDAARAETQHAMQLQREFVADASHELRTPLTSVLANLELLQATLGDGASEGGEMIDSALRSSRRMSRLVSDLLLLARADAGRAGQQRRCDLAEITAAALTEVEPVAGRRELSLSGPSTLPVEGNPDELHRMVLNLLDNAVRHTPDGSVIEANLTSAAGRAILEVSDDGPGIPEGLSEQVFERFARSAGPADTAGADGGTGLGLAIVRAVAATHGGAVEAAQSQMGGALFRVSLPLEGRENSEEVLTPRLEAI